MGASAPPGREIKIGDEFMGVSCKCIPEGESAPPRILYWAEEGVAFTLGVLHRVRRMMTKKVDSISE